MFCHFPPPPKFEIVSDSFLWLPLYFFVLLFIKSYAEAKENLRLKNQMEKAETMRKIEKMAITVGNPNQQKIEEDEDIDDEEFMKMYRQKRLAEMQQSSRY